MAKMASRLKFRERELTVADAISEAFGDLTSLAEEMREAYDNTPESLQQSGVGEARGEAADALENISEPDVPDDVGSEKFKFQEPVLSPSRMRKRSRAARRDDAVALLQRVVDHLDGIVDAEEGSVNENKRAAAESLRDEVQGMIDEAEGVEFPGMYG